MVQIDVSTLQYENMILLEINDFKHNMNILKRNMKETVLDFTNY